MSEENATENAIAAPAESAPANETEVSTETAGSTESAPEPEQASQNIEDEGSKPSKAVQELIAQRKRRQVAEQDAAYWRGIAEGRGHKSEPAPTQQRQAEKVPDLVAPNSDNFETWEAYEQAKDDYLVNKAEQRIALKFQQQQARQTQEQKQTSFNHKMEKAGEQDPELYTIMEDRTLPLHTHALPILFESDVAPELLKALNSDRKEATRIYQLFNTNPVLGARELGRLEAKITNTPKPAPPKRVSQAPEPIPTVTPSGGKITDEDSLPVDQWIARRNKAQYGR